VFYLLLHKQNLEDPPPPPIYLSLLLLRANLDETLRRSCFNLYLIDAMSPSGMTSSSYCQELPPKTRNLKSSCDFCALSKVKCDRGWPHCSRCIRNQVECHYSETRRTAKVRQQCATPGRIKSSTNNNATSKDQSKQQSESESGDNTPPNVSGTQTPIGELLVSSDSVMSMDIFDQQQTYLISELPDHSKSNPHSEPLLDLSFLHQESQNDFSHMLSSQLDVDGQSMELMKEISMQCAPLDLASTLDEHGESYSQGQQSSIDHETGCMKRACKQRPRGLFLFRLIRELRCHLKKKHKALFL
jgi:hypothetical protein